MLRCQLQPFYRSLIILENARAFTQSVAELVLRVDVAMLGGPFQPR